jgi:hypothetical protein
MIEGYILLIIMLLGAISLALLWTRSGRWMLGRCLLWFFLVLIIRPPGPLSVMAITVFVFRASLWTAVRCLWWRLQNRRGLTLTFNGE